MKSVESIEILAMPEFWKEVKGLSVHQKKFGARPMPVGFSMLIEP